MSDRHLSDNNEEFKSRISQESNAPMHGGMQVCDGNNNYLSQDNSTHIHIHRFDSPYLKLKNDDFTTPLHLLGRVQNYIGVILFLLSTLFSWTFFGLGAGFPFPYQQGVDLFMSCFNGKIVEKINSFQKDFQYEGVSSKSVEDLNHILFQANLYLGILERLDPNGGEADDRLAKTIEALKSKKDKIKSVLEPKQKRKYQKVIHHLNNATSFLKSFRGDIEIEKIERALEEVTKRIKSNDVSQSLYKNTITWLLEESLDAQKIRPYRLGVMYRVQNLIRELENQDMKNSPFRRYLNGDYLGNISKLESKYHSQKKCQHWKALAFVYMLDENPDREIISATDSSPFVLRRMEPCEFCHPEATKFSESLDNYEEFFEDDY
jgi:hypothetical protein